MGLRMCHRWWQTWLGLSMCTEWTIRQGLFCEDAWRTCSKRLGVEHSPIRYLTVDKKKYVIGYFRVSELWTEELKEEVFRCKRSVAGFDIRIRGYGLDCSETRDWLNYVGYLASFWNSKVILFTVSSFLVRKNCSLTLHCPIRPPWGNFSYQSLPRSFITVMTHNTRGTFTESYIRTPRQIDMHGSRVGEVKHNAFLETAFVWLYGVN